MYLQNNLKLNILSKQDFKCTVIIYVDFNCQTDTNLILDICLDFMMNEKSQRLLR